MTSLSKIQQEQDFKNLCKLTTNLLELPEGVLSSKSRKQELQTPRTVVSVVARMINETHQTVIAKELNRDRSLIYHYEKMHQSNYRTFPEYREIFNKIYNAYIDIQGAKRAFIDMYHLREHLRQNGIKHSSICQTTIRITSGEVGVDIKLSYRDFSDQLELINLALRDCKYNLEIL